MERLKDMGIIPINKDILYSLFDELKFPENKVAELKRTGLIIGIKNGLYVASSKVHYQKISRELVANHLYRPSYVSLETALSYYGLIPERVYVMRSACLKMNKKYNTPLGNFEFIRVPSSYFPIGVSQEIIGHSYAFLIASPEKALCDMISTTPNIKIQSVKAMQIYLEEDLRFEMLALHSFDIEIVKQCIEFGRKKTELTQLLKLLQNGK